jgi:hypothetical protein
MIHHVSVSIHLSLHMIQLKNHWTDLDEIYYGCYAVGIYIKLYI